MGPASFALALILAAVIAFAGVWDAIALFSGSHESTISEIVFTWSQRMPIIPFLTGVLIGHLFFPIRTP